MSDDNQSALIDLAESVLPFYGKHYPKDHTLLNAVNRIRTNSNGARVKDSIGACRKKASGSRTQEAVHAVDTVLAVLDGDLDAAKACHAKLFPEQEPEAVPVAE